MCTRAAAYSTTQSRCCLITGPGRGRRNGRGRDGRNGLPVGRAGRGTTKGPASIAPAPRPLPEAATTTAVRVLLIRCRPETNQTHHRAEMHRLPRGSPYRSPGSISRSAAETRAARLIMAEPVAASVARARWTALFPMPTWAFITMKIVRWAALEIHVGNDHSDRSGRTAGNRRPWNYDARRNGRALR